LSVTFHIVSNIPPSNRTRVLSIYHRHTTVEIFNNRKRHSRNLFKLTGR